MFNDFQLSIEVEGNCSRWFPEQIPKIQNNSMKIFGFTVEITFTLSYMRSFAR